MLLQSLHTQNTASSSINQCLHKCIFTLRRLINMHYRHMIWYTLTFILRSSFAIDRLITSLIQVLLSLLFSNTLHTRIKKSVSSWTTFDVHDLPPADSPLPSTPPFHRPVPVAAPAAPETFGTPIPASPVGAVNSAHADEGIQFQSQYRGPFFQIQYQAQTTSDVIPPSSQFTAPGPVATGM